MEHLKRPLIRALLVTTVLLLGVALPVAIREDWEAGSLYLFSHRFWDDLLLRFHSSGRFRFLLQPSCAVLFGILNGRKDAASGRHGYLQRIISREAGWKESIRHGLDTVSILLIMGILADIIFQFLILGIVRVVPALLLGPLFVSVPYVIARGVSSRIKRGSRKPS